MTREEWKPIIEEQIKIDKNYLPSFQTSIMILCEILEQRDVVFDTYIQSGGQPVVMFTSDRKAENLKENPLLKVWKELNTEALAYLNALGLTASGLRKLRGQLPQDSGGMDKLEEWRRKLGLSDMNFRVFKPDINNKTDAEQLRDLVRMKCEEDKKKSTSGTRKKGNSKTNGK